MSRLGDTRTWVTAQVALDAGADVAVFHPGRPVKITRFGYIWNAATVTAPETLDVDLDLRILTGSDTGRTAAQATIAGTAGETQGKGGYVDLATPIDVDADEEIVVQVANAATAGDGYVFIEYQEMPFVGDAIGANLTDKTA